MEPHQAGICLGGNLVSAGQLYRRHRPAERAVLRRPDAAKRLFVWDVLRNANALRATAVRGIVG